MAPVAERPFLVAVLLDQSLSQDGNTITLTRDIFEEALPAEHCRYLALSTRDAPTWQIYMTRRAPSASGLHSTVWLPTSIYSKYYSHQVYAHHVRPVVLRSVLISFPHATYHLSKRHSSELHALSQQGYIFRTGDSVDIDGYRGRIIMCEPVCQGLLSATTEIVLAKEQPGEQPTDVYGDVSDDDDEIEQVQFSGLLEGHQITGQNPLRQSQLQYSLATLQEMTDASTKRHKCAPLATHIPSELIVPRPSTFEDDQYCIFASVEQLIEIGCFSGDTVRICIAQSQDGFSRTLRIYSLPSDDSSIERDTFYLPPILYHNASSASPSHGPNKDISLTRVDNSATYSVAKAVTLGRVPSPASNDRALQSAFFTSLKVHFENSHRVVKTGDLVLLGIDETLARLFSADDQDGEVMSGLMQTFSERFDTFGWFKVLNVETEEDASWQQEAYVDATSTRMVQAGVEKARIPPTSEWASYVGIPQLAQPLEEPGSPYARLFELVNSTFSKSARNSRACATVLLHGARGSGKRTLVSCLSGALGMHFLELNCYDIVGESDLKTEAHLRLRFEKASHCAPCVLLLRNIDALAKKKDDVESGQESAMRFILADCLSAISQEAGKQFPVAVIATTADKEKIPEGVLGCFRHEFEISAPNESARFSILQALTRRFPLAPDVSVRSLAVRSAALVATDLVNVVKRAQNFAQERMDNLTTELGGTSSTDIYIAGGWITAHDFDESISEARRDYSDSIGAPKIPSVTWDDVGGLASVKDDIMDTIQLPLERPELFASGMKKRSGILFYGPPGTGKTLLAKAVATSFSLNFFSVKGPELLNMYIGESEANVRRVFQRARDAKPCVVFFDELDSVAPKRGNQGDSGGVMDRIVSQLLSELDGMSEGKDGSSGVFVIGATNRPDLLDPALLRPGRFDKMLYLGISDTDEAQYNILSALTRKFKLEPSLDLRAIAKACPFTYTGADFYALCSDAMLKAMTRRASAVDTTVRALDPPRSVQYFFDHLASKEDVEVVVAELDFMDALRELVPSVSQSELDHYKKVQAQFSPAKKEIVATEASGKGKAKEVTNGTAPTNGTNGHFHEHADNDNEDDEMYA